MTVKQKACSESIYNNGHGRFPHTRHAPPGYGAGRTSQLPQLLSCVLPCRRKIVEQD